MPFKKKFPQPTVTLREGNLIVQPLPLNQRRSLYYSRSLHASLDLALNGRHLLSAGTFKEDSGASYSKSSSFSDARPSFSLMGPLYSGEITTSAFVPKPELSNRVDLFVKLDGISQMQGVTEKSLSHYTFPPLRPAFILNQSHYEALAVPRSDHGDSNTQERVPCSVTRQKEELCQ